MTASLSKSTPFETTPNSVSSPQQRAVHIEMNDSEEKRVDEDEWATLRVLSNCSGSSWRSGAQAPYRSRLGWSAGALDHVLSPHTGSFHLYITGECFALPFSTKSSHFATALPLLLSPSFLSQNVPQVSLQEATNRSHFSTTTEVEIFETDGETLCNYL